MNYIDGVTGQLLTEESIIGSNVKTIKLGGDNYDMMRSLLYMVNPDSYVNNSSIGEGGFMCFYNEDEYDRTTKMLKSFGLSYEEQDINNSKNNNQNSFPKEIPSPYPSNKNIFKPEI